MHERNARFVSNEDEAPVASVSREEDDVDAARTPRRRHDKPLGHPLKRRAATACVRASRSASCSPFQSQFVRSLVLSPNAP